MENQKRKNTKWNLKLLYKNDTDPRIGADLQRAKEETQKFIAKWKNSNTYLKDPVTLFEALQEYETWFENFGLNGNVGYYFSLKAQLDKLDHKLKATLSKLDDESTKLANELEFFMHNIAKIPAAEQSKFLNEPKLSKYRHFLARVFEDAKYLLSEAEEKVLNIVETTSSANWVDMVSTFISKEKVKITDKDGEKQSITFEELMALLASQSKIERDNAAKAINKILAKHSDAAEAEINSILTYKKNTDDLRRAPRPDTFRHLSDDIDSETVDTLLAAVSKRYYISHEFYKLKAALLGVEKLAYHERNIEYGKVSKEYSYETAYELVHETFKKLDPEFASILDDYNNNGQIDVFPNKGKSGGAFCASVGIKPPVYVLLNHTNKLHDVLTLAHEMGHAINDELIKKRQSSLNAGTPLSTAEVASTFMEDFVLSELEDTKDEELKLSLMMMKLNDDVSSIFRQVACYRFEQELHATFRQKMHLSKEEIGELFKKHMASYMGPHVALSKGCENWWIYWGHIRSYFYVYSYASGLLISKSLQNSVKANGAFIRNIKEFLAAGSSKSPKEVFLDLGINISNADFWNKGLDEVEELLNKTKTLALKLKKVQE